MLKIQITTKRLLKDFKLSFVVWLLFLGILSYFVFSFNKGFLNIYFSNNYSKTFGLFFKYFTLLGEEWLILPICLLIFILLKRKDFILKAIITLLINFVLTKISKNYLFDSVRPSKFLENKHLIFTEGVNIHQYNSFPSGHTSTAFAIAFFLILFFKIDKSGIILIILAALVGISRIYLQQHFAEDVIGGSLIGLISAIIANSILIKKSDEN